MASKLAGLAVACRRAPAPQLWSGTSLAVTVDTGAVGLVAPHVAVKLFAWGQASFTTQEQHQQLAPSVRRERAQKWRHSALGAERARKELERSLEEVKRGGKSVDLR